MAGAVAQKKQSLLFKGSAKKSLVPVVVFGWAAHSCNL